MSGNNDGNGVEHLVVPVMTITVDPRTGMPSYRCTELPVGFWQMVLDEIVRQLEEQRRIAGAMQLRKQVADQAAAEAIAASLRKQG